MSDLKMKLNTTSNLKLKMKANDNLTMKFSDYQGSLEEHDPIFKDSPAYTITEADINNWNHKSNFDGNYNELYNKPNLSMYATKSELNEGLSGKVSKEEGMGLSQNSFTTEEKNKLSTLENYDDTEIVNELNTKADISSIPTKLSELDNDEGFITNTVDDLVNYPTNSSVDAAIGGKQNKIDSDNKLSADLVDDTTSANKFVTTSDITTWNNKSDFSGDYNDLTNKPTIPTLTSQLTNDSGFITNANIPTKTSDLTNDSGFTTTTYVDNSVSGNLIVESIISKNLFNGFLGGAYNSNTGIFDSSANGIASRKIDVISGNKYCLSGIQPGNTIRVLFWNSGTFVSSTTMTTQAATIITMSGNQFAFQTSTTTPYTNIQLEKGEEATTYAPYENLNGEELYSLVETRIGTYNDKPLYRVIINIQNPQTSNTDYVNVSSLNIKKLVHLYGHYTTSSGTFGIPLMDNSSTNYSVIFLSAAGYIRGRFGGATNITEAEVVIEYTKTTD